MEECIEVQRRQIKELEEKVIMQTQCIVALATCTQAAIRVTSLHNELLSLLLVFVSISFLLFGIHPLVLTAAGE